MFKTNLLSRAITLALILPGAAFAEVEISGEAKIEASVFTSDGQVTGSDEAHESGDALKTEGSVRLFINSDVGEESAIHAELLLADDGEAASDRLEGGESYSQYEILRELYLDTTAGDWDFRLGKQQVVWGTADGIKLLDTINPTDFREVNQNTPEESRIPIWMINAETDLDSGGNIQIIVSEAKANFIAGLDEDGDTGAPFIFKGVDSITGKTNGFLNIANDFGRTAGVFDVLLQSGGLSGLLGNLSLTTVSGFTALGNAGAPTFQQVGAGLLGVGPGQIDPSSDNGALFQTIFLPLVSQFGNGNVVLDQAANNAGSQLLPGFAGYLGQLQAGLGAGVADGAAFTNTATTVLDINGDGFADTNTVGQAFTALFGQFVTNVYAGLTAQGVNVADNNQVAGALSQGSGTTVTAADVAGGTAAYQGAIQAVAIAGLQQTSFQDGTTNQFSGTLDTENPTSAFDYMGNTTFGTFNDFVGMSTAYRNLHEDESDQNLAFRFKGETEGGTNFSVNYAYHLDSNPYVDIFWEDGSTGKELGVIKTVTTLDATTGAPSGSPSGTAGTVDVTTLSLDGKTAGVAPLLVFEEKLNRINSIGGSFDTAVDTDFAPIVIRGEFLYDAGVKQVIVDKDELGIGNLTAALTSEDTDMFKYVLGVDVTVLTNMLISTQLIQMYNLDFVDGDMRYTGDPSTLHLDNGLNKGDEVESFVSLFFSKPFGAEQQHRWNNISIAENGGGYWNRFDVEYSFNDDIIGTFELNNYWGDEDTTFGQFKDSSNLQLGLKYLF